MNSPSFTNTFDDEIAIRTKLLINAECMDLSFTNKFDDEIAVKTKLLINA